MEIIKELNNELFNRREIKIIIPAEKTPSFEEASKIIAKQFKAPEENIVIKEIQGRFGRQTFLIGANVYKSKEDKEKTEPKPKKKKGEQTEEATPAAQSTPTQTEAPAEEAK